MGSGDTGRPGLLPLVAGPCPVDDAWRQEQFRSFRSARLLRAHPGPVIDTRVILLSCFRVPAHAHAQDESTMSGKPPPDPARPADYAFERLDVSGILRDRVTALVAVELRVAGPVPLAVVPHESMVLRVQLGRGEDPLATKGPSGLHAVLTGIREVTEFFHGAGDCVTLFALLTPLGAIELLDSRVLEGAPRIKAPIADLLDRRLALALESEVARGTTLAQRLERLAGWLEARATGSRRQAPAAVRTARAATRICRDPRIDVETVAREQVVSRRQLERDFQRWIGTSPRHLTQVARLQQVARRSRREPSLAAIAADTGFADQAHMSRVVRGLTGMTPSVFLRSRPSALATAFRIATDGATVYL